MHGAETIFRMSEGGLTTLKKAAGAKSREGARPARLWATRRRPSGEDAARLDGRAAAGNGDAKD